MRALVGLPQVARLLLRLAAHNLALRLMVPHIRLRGAGRLHVYGTIKRIGVIAGDFRV